MSEYVTKRIYKVHSDDEIVDICLEVIETDELNFDTWQLMCDAKKKLGNKRIQAIAIDVYEKMHLIHLFPKMPSKSGIAYSYVINTNVPRYSELGDVVVYEDSIQKMFYIDIYKQMMFAYY